MVQGIIFTNLTTEQNHKRVVKEISKLLSKIWRIKGLAEQEYETAVPHHQEARQILLRD